MTPDVLELHLSPIPEQPGKSRLKLDCVIDGQLALKIVGMLGGQVTQPIAPSPLPQEGGGFRRKSPPPPGKPEHPLRAYRTKHGITLRELAERAKITEAGLSRIETLSTERPSLPVLARLATACNGEVSAEDIFLHHYNAAAPVKSLSASKSKSPARKRKAPPLISIPDLLRLADIYCETEHISLASLGKRAIGNRGIFQRLKEGHGANSRSIAQLGTFFRADWPYDNAPWPTDVPGPRPDLRKITKPETESKET